MIKLPMDVDVFLHNSRVRKTLRLARASACVSYPFTENFSKNNHINEINFMIWDTEVDWSKRLYDVL
jgi:hypothetical protein